MKKTKDLKKKAILSISAFAFAIAFLSLINVYEQWINPTDSMSKMFLRESTEIKKHHYDVHVKDSGSMYVVETINYELDDVNGVIRDYEYDVDADEAITMRSVKVNGMNSEQVSYASNGESGVYTFKQECGAYNVADLEENMKSSCTREELKIFQPTDGKLEVELAYTIDGIVTEYNDMQDFYWMFYNTNTAERTLPSENVSLSIKFPQDVDKEQMKLFAHGDIDGSVKFLDNRTVGVEIPFFPEGTFGEVRVLLPTKPLQGVTKIDPKDMYESALMYEHTEAEKTNAQIAKNAAKEKRDKWMSGILTILEIVAGFLAVILGFRSIYKIYALFDKEKYTYNLDYYREVATAYGPATAALVENPDVKIDQKQLTATLFDLYMKDKIKIDLMKTISKKNKEEEKVYITVLDVETHDLREEEKYLFTWLQSFGGVNNLFTYDAFMLQGHKPSAKEAEIFLEKYEKFLGMVKMSYNKLDYRQFPGRREKLKTRLSIPLIISLGSFFITVLFALQLTTIVIAFLMFMLIAFIIGIVQGYKYNCYRYTREGAEEHAKMKGLKRYLQDYSLLNEANPSLVELWEQYFVFGLSLGVTEKALKALYNSLPQAQMQQNMGDVYSRYYIMNRMITYHNINAFSQTALHTASKVVTAANVSRTSGRSSFGGGGGFSGGGGFGGGGGGGRSF